MSDIIRFMARKPQIPKPRQPKDDEQSLFRFAPFPGSIKRQHRELPMIEGVPPVPGMKRGIKDNET